MGRRIKQFVMWIILAVVAVSCGGGVSAKWQEQYDLGMKYLLDADYEEAVLAFTAAIEIEPKLPEAYIGRGDAYIGLSRAGDMGEADKNAYCDLALEDYMVAIEIKNDEPQYYEKLLDAYYDGAGIDMERLKKLLEIGIEKTESEDLQYLLDIMETPMGKFKNEDFKYYYELDEEGKASIRELVEIVKNSERDTIRVAMAGMEVPKGRDGKENHAVRTYYNGYKIEMDVYSMEVRPKEGYGYIWEDVSRNNFNNFIVGEIINWGWNGAFQTEYYHTDGSLGYAIRGNNVGGLICGIPEYRDNGAWKEDMYYEDGHMYSEASYGDVEWSIQDAVKRGKEFIVIDDVVFCGKDQGYTYINTWWYDEKQEQWEWD